MKYKKNQYTEGFSVCGLIIGGAFLTAGAFLLRESFPWFIPGLVFLGVGITIIVSQIRAVVNRSKLRRVVKNEFETNAEVSVEDISKSTGISKKDVQAIILDLKAEGSLKGAFSPKSGKMETKSVEKIPTQNITYCPNCGSNIKQPDAEYCEYCGAKL
ncbi:MAG: zinc-ribbon domain-containing protein [Candidatus Lokiarchaeota archaeon]|nr:zinc-ribbon domain-containing protein [Candidatus Lokiarchaeota archaeon]MBD3338464.1 zinc-ribbon domain-containing protein [Candidatus Lokiarchaeota archaeon]